jgi:hypothetical protein
MLRASRKHRINFAESWEAPTRRAQLVCIEQEARRTVARASRE